MPNYKQTQITAESWTRCNKVICDNPYTGGKMVTFIEERVIDLGDGPMTQPTGVLVEHFGEANATEQLDLIHPDTGAVIGQATFQQVYLMLHSLYMHAAIKRDTAPVYVPVPDIPIPNPEPDLPQPGPEAEPEQPTEPDEAP